MRVLAIDQGTTSTRGILHEPGKPPSLVLSLRHRQIYPATGWVEHDPREILANIRAVIEAAGPVDAIGIANQGESCLAWDAVTHEPLTPIIVWQDARTAGRMEVLGADGAASLVMARAGLPLDPYFSASKLAWILDTSPEARARLAAAQLRLGTTDAFFIEALTGRAATDVTTASRTSLMNLDRLEWDPQLASLFDVPIEALPPITNTTADFGGVMVAGRPVPVTASLVDQQAALYGHGCRARGDAKITFGTGAFVLAVTGSEVVRAEGEGILPTVAWRKAGEAAVYAIDGGVYTASAALDWAKGLGLFADYADLDALEGPPAIESGVAFVPALAGLACPHWDRRARGAFMGLGLDTTPATLTKAVLEGVAFRTAEVIDAFSARIDLSPSISVDGGMAENHRLVQFLADILGRPLTIPADGELTARGTASLAAEAIGGAIDPAPVRVTIPPRTDRAFLRRRFAAAVASVQAYGAI